MKLKLGPARALTDFPETQGVYLITMPYGMGLSSYRYGHWHRAVCLGEGEATLVKSGQSFSNLANVYGTAHRVTADLGLLPEDWTWQTIDRA